MKNSTLHPKYVIIIITIFLLSVAVQRAQARDGYIMENDFCCTPFQLRENYKLSKAYDSGYKKGFDNGISAGYSYAFKKNFKNQYTEKYVRTTSDYMLKYNEGLSDGYQKGFKMGYEKGIIDGGTHAIDSIEKKFEKLNKEMNIKMDKKYGISGF